MNEETVVNQRDWCLLISNLVKNAVEAAEKVMEKTPEIVFKVHQGKDFIEIICSNTYQGEINIGKNQKLTTSKLDKEQHGFGQEIIQQIVSKYQGNYHIITEKGMFTTNIILKLDHSHGYTTVSRENG